MKMRREKMPISKQAQHNCALFPCQEYNRIFFKGVFPCQEYNRIFFKGVFRPFLYGWGTPFCVA